MKTGPALSVALLLALVAGALPAAETDPLPVPKASAAASATRLYNEGVALLVARKFAEAQAKFEASLTLDDRLAEAHNNLAYALRMQGRQNFDKSLTHYNRAIALNPALAQAYAYRGVLFMQQGDMARARGDLETLRRLDAKLAKDLESALSAGKAEGERGGIAAQYE